jgi:hypothetical protein
MVIPFDVYETEKSLYERMDGAPPELGSTVEVVCGAVEVWCDPVKFR